MEIKNFIYGASGHAKVVLDIFRSNKISITAVVDDNPKCNLMLGIPVFSFLDYPLEENSMFVVAIGNNAIRKKIVLANNFHYLNGLHAFAFVSDFVKLGEGIVVMSNATINADVTIGNHCIINSNAVVEHDCILEDYVHISPSASLAGNVLVGEGSQVGIGANIIQGITIGKWATIGAGAVIINDVPDYAVVVGNPGKVIKFTNHEY